MQALQIITRSLGRKGKLLASRQQKRWVLFSESDYLNAFIKILFVIFVNYNNSDYSSNILSAIY